MPMARIKTLFELIIECFDDRMLRVLLAAAFVSLVIGVINDGWDYGWIDGSSIFFAVFIITSVTAGNNYAKERQFQKLQAKEREGQTVAVYRNGELVTKSTTELVVGDIIKLEKGKEIPADCVMISGNDLTCNESSLTGEPLDLAKKPLDDSHEKVTPFLLAKTLITNGDCIAIVCAVGVRTRSGKAGEKLRMCEGDEEEEDEEKKKPKVEGEEEEDTEKKSSKTPLQIKLDKIVKIVENVGLKVAGLTLAVLTGKLLIMDFYMRDACDPTIPNDPNCLEVDYIGLLKEVIRFFIIAVTIVVVAIPEGLPLAVTISLAYSVG